MTQSDATPATPRPATARHKPAGLISSDRVEGTAVFDPSGNRLGSIASLMIDKVAGRVEYAVLSFGGFLGIGSQQFPLPWSQLRYDIGLEGYVVNVTEQQLQTAPSFAKDAPVDWSDDDWGEKLRGHYGPAPYGSHDGM